MKITTKVHNLISEKHLRLSAIAGSLGVKVGAAMLTIIVAAILGKLLGADGYGAYAYAISWLTILSLLAAFGLDVLAIREIAQTMAKEEWGALRGFLSWSLKRVTLSSIGLAIGMFLLISLVQNHLPAAEVETLWIAALFLPTLALLRLLLGMVQGFGRPVVAQVPQMVLLPALILVIVGFLWLFNLLNAQWAVGAYGFATCMALVSSMWLLARSAKSIVPCIPVRHRKQWLHSATAFMLGGFGIMFNNQIGVIMLGSMAGPREAAIFDIAMKASTLVAFVLMAVNIPMGPMMAVMYTKGDRENLQQLATRAAWFALIGAIPVAGGLIILGPWLLRWMGEGFATGSIALTILCLGQVINAGAGSVGLILNMSGHERETAWTVFIAGILNAVFCLILIPAYGLEGAALSAALSMIIWNVRLVERVFHRIHINPTVFSLGHSK